MAITKKNFCQTYRNVILFNKNLILSGIISFLAGALTTQIYALFDSNNLSNAVITLLIGYCVYIPLFAILFYRDNKSRYVDPLTGKKNSKNIKEDTKKLFGTFSVSEIIFIVTKLYIQRFIGELVGDPEKEEGFLNERSPITYVDKIKATMNLLIIQGANDPKVVKNESDQIVERLRNKGIGVEYIIFDDEGHGFTKYSNLIKALKKSAEFLAKLPMASHYIINYNRASLSPTGHRYH